MDEGSAVDEQPSAAPPVAAGSGASASGEGWELVSRDVPAVGMRAGDLEAVETVRSLVRSFDDGHGRRGASQAGMRGAQL